MTSHDELSIRLIHRSGQNNVNGVIKHERNTIDFVVNGQSLYDLLKVAERDMVGCFWNETPESNEENANNFLLNGSSDIDNGRVMLYVCPECGDIGCGAITIKITKSSDGYVWSDFAYENNYDTAMTDRDSYKNIGPFIFAAKQYEKIIEEVRKIG